MRRRARAYAITVVLAAAVASGCGGSQTGTVQGRVIFKVGTTSRFGSGSTLQLFSARPGSHGAVLATQKVSPTGTYHFTVAPGAYSFSDLTLGNCYGTVTVRSGQVIHHDVICQPTIAVG
jgi:hypothetical protein